MAGNKELKILIRSELEKTTKQAIINQLEDIKKKYGNLEIKMQLNDSVTKTLQGFTSAMEKFKTASDNANKTVTQTQDVYKNLDGSVRTVTRNIDALGQVTDKVRTVHDASKKAMTDESAAALKLAESIKSANKAGIDSITITKNQENAITGLVAKSSKGFTTTTTRLQADGQTLIGSSTKTDYAKERNQQVKEAKLLANEINKVKVMQAERLASLEKNYDKAHYQALVQNSKRDKYLDDKRTQDAYVARKQANTEDLRRTADKLKSVEQMQKQEQQAYQRNEQKKLQIQQRSARDSQKLLDTQNKAEIQVLNMNRRYGTGGNNVDNAQLNSLLGQLKGLTTTSANYRAEAARLSNEINKISASAKSSTGSVINFSDALKSAIIRLPTFMLAGLAVREFFSFFKDGITFVNELNKSLTELSIVYMVGQSQVEKYAETFSQLGSKMGILTSDIAKGAVEFARQGLAPEETMRRMESATRFAAIGNISFADSAKILTSSVNSMGVDIDRATDVFSAIGDSAATSAVEVGEALQRTGGAANNVGASFEKVASWVGQISSSTRESAFTIGNSIKSIIARVQSLKENGFDAEDGVNTNQVSKALGEVGIQLVDSNKQFRDFGIVMDELGAKWGSLDSRTQAYISTTVSGSFQSSRFATLMNGYADSVRLYDIAMGSAGISTKKMDLYMAGSEAALNRLKNAWTNIYLAAFQSDGIRSLMGTLAGLGDGITSLVKTFGLLPLVVGAATFALLAFKSSMISTVVLKMVGESLLTLRAAVLLYTGSLGAARLATVAFQATLTLGLSLAVTGAVIVFSKLMSNHKKLVDQQKAVEAQNKIITESWTTQKDSITSLVVEYNKLYDLTNDGKKFTDVEQEKRYLEVVDQLSKLMPNLVDSIDAKGKAHLRSAKAIEQEIGYAQQLSDIENANSLLSAKDDFRELIKDRESAQKALDKVNKSMRISDENMKKGGNVLGILTAEAYNNLKIQAIAYEQLLNSSADTTNEKLISLGTIFSNIKLSDSFNLELKKIIESLDNKELSADQLTSKSLALRNLISTLDSLKKSSSPEEADKLNQKFLEQVKILDLTSEAAQKLFESYMNGDSVLDDATKATNAQVLSEEDLKKAMEENAKLIKEKEDQLKTLNNVISDSAKNTHLSAEATEDLIRLHPELASKITQVSDGYVIEASALEDVRLGVIDSLDTRLKAEANITTDFTNKLNERLLGYGAEMVAITDLASAKEAQSKVTKAGLDAINKMPEGSMKDQALATYNQQGNSVDTDISKMLVYYELLEKVKNRSYGVSADKEKPEKEPPSTAPNENKAEAIQRQDIIAGQIKSINEQRQATESLNESYERKIKLFDKEKDYQNSIEQTTLLLEGQAKLLKETGSANEQIQSKAVEYRNGLSKDPLNKGKLTKETLDSFFDSNGEQSSAYIKYLNDIALKSEKIVKSKLSEKDKKAPLELLADQKKYAEDAFESLSKLKQAYKTNSDAAIELSDSMDANISLVSQKRYDLVHSNLNMEVTAAKVAGQNELEIAKFSYDYLKGRIGDLHQYTIDDQVKLNGELLELKNNLNDQIVKQEEDLAKEYIETLKKTEQYALDLKEAQLKIDKKSNETLIDGLQTILDGKEVQLKLDKELSQTRIDGYQDEMDALEESNEISDDAVEKLKKQTELAQLNTTLSIYQGDTLANLSDEMAKQLDLVEEKADAIERQNELLKAQQELETAKNEKNVRLFKDGAFQWVADPKTVRDLEDKLKQMTDDSAKEKLSKVEDLNGQIKDKTEELAKFISDIERKQQKKSLQDKIDHENDLIKLAEDTFTKEKDIFDQRKKEIESTITTLDDAFQQEKDAFDLHWKDIDLTTKTYLDSLKTTYGDKWEEILEVLRGKVKTAQELYAQLAGANSAIPNTPPSSSSNSGGGGWAGVPDAIENGNNTAGGTLGGVLAGLPNGFFDSTPESLTWQEKLAKAASDDAFAQSELDRAKQAYKDNIASGDLAGANAAHKYADQLRDENSSLPKFKTGGLNTQEGIAMLHGTANKPELVLNALDTKNILDTVKLSRFNPLSYIKMPDLSSFVNKFSGGSNSNDTHYHIDTINVRANNVDQLINSIKLKVNNKY